MKKYVQSASLPWPRHQIALACSLAFVPVVGMAADNCSGFTPSHCAKTSSAVTGVGVPSPQNFLAQNTHSTSSSAQITTSATNTKFASTFASGVVGANVMNIRAVANAANGYTHVAGVESQRIQLIGANDDTNAAAFRQENAKVGWLDYTGRIQI